jgi:hypothetical protein
MNRVHRRAFSFLIVLIGLLAFVGCQHDPQTIFNVPRTLPSKVDTTRGVRKPNLSAKAEPPKPKPLPPSNGVDVPILDLN